ncbi:MAG: SIR2 family protein [Candidatus Celaenobacter polaris]|nr:SIR2 family protein [Candidatus Celaenobacter polaris]
MANYINIDESNEAFSKNLQKAIQSANLNFLIGSGCSFPAISSLGNIENDVQVKIENGELDEANKLIFNFLNPFLESTNQLLKGSDFDNEHEETLGNYKIFLESISKILFERKSNILHKQATVFTTNYDLFIEKNADENSDFLILNDGFKRTPSLSYTYKLSTSEFFNTTYNTGNLYRYQVQVPVINLIKLHGSLNWEIKNGNIVHSLEYLSEAEKLKNSDEPTEIEKFVGLFTLILPKKDKFKETIQNQIYYDLLRIYANELDKENTLLIAEGFSFADEHILDLTKRALKNPTLKIIVFCFSAKDKEIYHKMFSAFNNVEIVYSEENISFEKFNIILSDILPKNREISADLDKIEDFSDE